MPASLQRRYLSLWLRRLATDRLAASPARSRSGTPDEPLVVTRLVKSALRIVAMDDAAQRLGLRVGMPLADARAMYPALAVAASDEEADRRLLDAVADWCDRYTPLVGLDAPDGLMLDIAGCAHLFGGEAAMGRDMLKRLAAQGLSARAAIADTPGAAFAVARFGGASVVPPGAMRQALAPLPVAALRLSPDTAESLAELGLKRIVDLIDLPRAPLAARFGEGLVRRLDQALGQEDEPITPRLPVPSYVAEQRFPDPIGLARDVLGVITRLAARLGAAMERRQDGARLLQVALFRTDNKVYRIAVGTGAPVRDAARIARLFADRLATVGDACDPGFGFDMVRLAAVAVERSEPVQGALSQSNRVQNRLEGNTLAFDGVGSSGLSPGGGGNDDTEFSHLIDRLGARFGLHRVVRLVEQDTHIPEFAVMAMPAHAVRAGNCIGQGTSAPSPRIRNRLLPISTLLQVPKSGKPDFGRGECRGEGQPEARRAELNPHAKPRPGPSPVALARTNLSSQAGGGEEQDSLSPTRPVRLFGRPEPVEAIAEVPDGPPARFRWRRVLHEVAVAEGPERIATEWWRDADGQALTRDYFRVESREGLRVWLYREGLYGRETAAPRWFLHGVFG